MPGFDWQLLIVAIAVGAAAFFLIRRGFRLLVVNKGTRQSGCGSCGDCGTSNSAPSAGAFIPLESLRHDGSSMTKK